MNRSSVLASALSLSLAACGADEAAGESASIVPVPGCEYLDPAPCDTLETECQASRLELAACLRGCEPGELPPVTRWSEEMYAAALTASFSEAPPRPSPDHFERALSQLNLVAPGAFQVSAMLMARVELIWGFYDPETRGITLIDHGSPAADARSNLVLLHELVHALQDRDVSLATYGEGAESSDQALAMSSVVEGEARFHEDRYAASLSALDPARLDLQEVFLHRILLGETWTLGQPSPWLASRSVFPYDYGERFLDLVWRAGGREAVLNLFANPPRTSWALMASTDEPRESPPPNDLSAPTPPEGWALFAEDELGARSLLFALARGEGTEPFRSSALAWRSDHLAVYAGPGVAPATALVWQIELSDETHADAVVARLGGLLSGARVRRLGTRAVVALATSAIALDWAFPEL